MGETVLVSGSERDVLVVGAGPSGAACAYWLAEAGHDVLLVEKKRFPREKTCGDGLTPRAVKQLDDMGLGGALAEHGHRFAGLRSIALEDDLQRFADIARHDLDQLVAERAEKAGVELWEGAEATAPILDAGLVRGATVERSGALEPVRARYVVVADGANSRFGRSLGTTRDRSYPQGMAIRGYYSSPRHDEPWIESHLDVRDRHGNVLPGYGWIFPVGDGRVNVGVGLLSTFNQWKEVNTSRLMDAFVQWAPESWGLSAETSCGPPVGGRLPMGSGAINPFNGEGIAYAYETGRYAAEALDGALRTGDGMALHRYEQRVHDEYDLYYRVARAFVKIIGRPELMRVLVGTGMRSRPLMEWVLRIMANLLRPDEIGPAEAAYRAVAAIARLAPTA